MNDLISRQDAIDAVLKRDAGCGIDSAEVIKDLPSAQQWIPCSERLPEDTGFYLCSVRDYPYVKTAKFELWADGGYGWILVGGRQVQPQYILAWMPLPQPWKEVEDE